jgi:hypothetical protein
LLYALGPFIGGAGSERRRVETMARLSSTLRSTFAEERCELPPEFIDLLDRIDGRRG